MHTSSVSQTGKEDPMAGGRDGVWVAMSAKWEGQRGEASSNLPFSMCREATYSKHTPLNCDFEESLQNEIKDIAKGNVSLLN